MAGLHADAGHSGITPREAVIMNLWDAGRSIEQIARSTSTKRERVRRVICANDVGDERLRERRAMERCSRHLLTAIRNAQAASSSPRQGKASL